MLKQKTLVSWSSGKDSAYALHKIRQEDKYEIAGILCTVTEGYDRVSMHSTRRNLLELQTQQLNLPLQIVSIPANCTDKIYENRMHAAMELAIQQGITHIAFGDLFLENIRQYREEKLSKVGLKPLFPLWGQDTSILAHEMIDAGIKALITCIDPKKLAPSFAGRQFDKMLLKDLPAGVDPCAENGEFHTFVYDGPMFTNSISTTLGSIVERDGFVFMDVTKEEWCP